MEVEGTGGLDLLDRVVAGAGLALFASSFLPWFRYSLDGGGLFRDTSSTVIGWRVGLGWGGLAALLGLVTAVLVLVGGRGGDTLPDVPLSRGQLQLGAGGLAAVVVTLKLLVGQHHGVYDVSRSFGLYLATAAALVFAGAGLVRYQREQAPT